jgi:hypothetical protein
VRARRCGLLDDAAVTHPDHAVYALAEVALEDGVCTIAPSFFREVHFAARAVVDLLH